MSETNTISPLRQRMIEDMAARKLNPHTQRSHISSCKRFAAWLKRSPDTATPDEVRRFQLHLVEGGASICNRNRIMTGVRFLFRVTLRRHDLAAEIWHIQEPQKLPPVLSPEEVKRVLTMATSLKARAMLTLAYGCGLRASEVVRLRACDIDSEQMIIRIVQSKGRKDRNVMLPAEILDLLRQWWKARPTRRDAGTAWRLGVSGRKGCLRERIVGGLESLSEAGAERAIIDGAANLKQKIRPSPRPAHLLRFVHPAVHQKIGRPFGDRGADPQSGTVPLGVVDQPVALSGEITIQCVQGGPQLSRRRNGPPLPLFPLKMMHHCADTTDADLSILGFAIPQPPVQALDLRDNHRLRRHPCRVIRRQTAGCLLQVLQPHGDVEPVEHRRLGDTGISQNAPQAGAPVGERGQHRVLGSPDGVEAAADQHFDVRIGFGDGAENLPPASLRFNIADPHLQMPLAVLAAADEGRIQGHGDRRSRRIRPHRGLIPKLRTNFQSVQTQSFRVVSGVDREHLPQHVSSHPVSHQGREMRLKLIQLRRRAAIRWPTMAGFVAAAPSTAKAGKPHRDLAEKRRDRMVPVILHSAHLATASAVRPPDGVALGLRRDDLLLEAGQQQLPFGQGQP